MTRSRALVAFPLLAALIMGSTGCAHMMARFSGPGVTDEHPGTRTLGMVVEDQTIETKILGNLYKLDARYSDYDTAVLSFNGVVLLAGAVPEQALVQQAGDVAKRIRQVRHVHNELRVSIAPDDTLSDQWLHTKIRFVMNVTRGYPASRVRVLVRGGHVYLMGLVTEDEARQSVDIIKDISGIKRVIQIFEVVAAPPPQAGSRPDSTPQPPAAEPMSTSGDNVFFTSPLSD